MNYDLSRLELKIISLLDTALSISELAERTSVTKGYTSRAVASLKDKGFVETSKRGITKKVTLSANLHASKLKTLLSRRSYMPFAELLHGSGLPIMAVLASGSADFTLLRDESGVSKATLRRWIKKFKEHALLMFQNNEYALSHDLVDLKEFLDYYCSYSAASILKEISPPGNFITAKGFEFIFSNEGEIVNENVKPSGLTAISEYIPLMLAENHYFYSSRKLSLEEIAVHTIVIDPHSKRNLTYVILFILKTELDRDIFLKIAKRYRVEEIAKSVLKLLNTWEKPEEPYIPDPAYVKEKLKEYKIKMEKNKYFLK